LTAVKNSLSPFLSFTMPYLFPRRLPLPHT
jgi:hypothetical protein